MNIYYFSGTGNSYYIANKLGKMNNNSKIYSILDYQDKDKIKISNTKVVIVSPLYFYNIPPVVNDFLNNLELKDIEYFSVIYTAEFPNGLAINTLKKICKEKNITLNSCFYIKMPTNYLIKSNMLNDSKIELLIQKANVKTNKISEIIKTNKTFKEKDYWLYSLIVNAKNSWNDYLINYESFSKLFEISTSCSKCMLCKKICPVNNIYYTDKIHWKSNCLTCLRCINVCPNESIQYGSKTINKTRYFNPYIEIDSI